MVDLEKIDELITQRHNKAEIIVSLFFLGVDVVTFFICSKKFGFNFNDKAAPNNKIFIILIIDIILRIVNYFSASFDYCLKKEIFVTCVSSSQFYLLISALSQIFSDKNCTNMLRDDIGIRFKELSAIVFYFFAFVFQISKIFSLFQNIGACLVLFSYFIYIYGKIKFFLQNVEKKIENLNEKNYFLFFPIFSLIYLLIYYSLRILNLIVSLNLYSSYMDMACMIFKEAGKYISFIILMIIYNIFQKYIYADNISYSQVSQSSVTVTHEKDEDKLKSSRI